MFKDQPGKIFAVRNVSPMVATYCDDGAFIASDLTAFIKYSKRYFILPEYTIMTMTADGIEMEDLEGKKVEPDYLEVNWDVTAAQKDGYPHFMIKEIHEQRQLSQGLSLQESRIHFLVLRMIIFLIRSSRI